LVSVATTLTFAGAIGESGSGVSGEIESGRLIDTRLLAGFAERFESGVTPNGWGGA
jgi:hypothetical protein